MEILDAIKNRRSIRKYKSDKVSKEDIKTILTSAMMAPSACNTRPWDFIVIENEEIKKELVKVHPFAKMILEAPVVVVIIGRDDLQKGICKDFWPQDCAAATQNMLLTCLELGYGSCWCGVYPNMVRSNAVKEILKIEKGIPFNFVVIGKANEEPACKGHFEENKVTYIK